MGDLEVPRELLSSHHLRGRAGPRDTALVPMWAEWTALSWALRGPAHLHLLRVPPRWTLAHGHGARVPGQAVVGGLAGVGGE